MTDVSEFEWDERKRQATLAKHRIDFVDAVQIFAGVCEVSPARSDVEERWKAIGTVNGEAIAVFYTMRGSRCRIITARKARRNERDDLRALHAGAAPDDEG